MTTNSLIDLEQTRRDDADAEMRKIADKADKFGRAMSRAEKLDYETFEATRNLADTALIKLKAEHQGQYRDFPHNDVAAQMRLAHPGGIYTTSRGGVYSPEARTSYFLDVSRAEHNNDSEARQRLSTHTMEYNDAVKQRNASELRAISTTAGAGGEFAPPLWAIDQYIGALRAGRATANALTHEDLPYGTSVLDFPKIATGTTTAIQGTQNAAISNTDITSTSIAAPVYTIAGGQQISVQLFEQSPIAGSIDKLILGDLLADYNRTAGNLVINGTGTGQPFGLLNVSGITSVAYTDASPAVMGAGKLYAKIGSAVQSIQTARFESPTAIVMHPRRWAWISVQVDSSNRAIILPDDQGAFNATGIDTNNEAQGIVGRMFGLPVISDPNVPTNLGAGTNQDPIIVAKLDDTWLFEQQPRLETFNQTYANTLSLYVRLYNYAAMVTRYGNSIAVINGTGTITPTF